ncbi:hypothetical protein I3843_05G090400 [Carya illinoinensis]|nr:hypothetical protein I3843_05G090400 [Carya illinoinensis]
MSFNIGIEDISLKVLQELCNKAVVQATELVNETKEVMLNKDCFQKFLRNIYKLKNLLGTLNFKKVVDAKGLESTKAALETLNFQLKKACKIIKDYKSGSHVHLILKSHSMLSQMQDVAKDIATFATDAVALEIENLISRECKNQKHAVKLLEKITEAVGANVNASMMETQKKQAEALQLSQLIQFLYSTEIFTIPDDERIASHHQHYPIDSFICPLRKEMMTDPVAIPCGRSFERKAIQEHFGRGEKNCTGWTLSNDHSRQKKALEDMQGLLEMPLYAIKFAEEGLVPKLVEILKTIILNMESIVTSGAVRYIVKQIYKDGIEPVAIAILLELLERETLSEKIGSTKDSIPLLVSLLPNDNLDVSQYANKVLQKLSSNTHFVVKMTEVGHFQPFVARFNQGPQETRTLMAAALIEMQLKESNINDLQNKEFIHKLVQMLSSRAPACKVACLRSIKKLIQYPKMVKRLLKDLVTIPHLLGLISFFRSDSHVKEEAAEILALLIGASQVLDKYRGLQELQSKYNASLLLQGAANSDPQTKVQFLHLLVELYHESETAQNLIQSNMDAVGKLLSLLHSDQPGMRLWTMKLIYLISEDHPAGAPLPPSPAKETAIETLACILTSSPDIEESKPKLQVGKLEQYPSLVCVLSGGSSLAKQQAAIALAKLSQSTSLSLSDGTLIAEQAKHSTPVVHVIMKFLPNMSWCYSTSAGNGISCSVHGVACSDRDTFYLVKVDAVKPLVQTLSETESGVAEAALMAPETLLTEHSTLSRATAAIVDNQGVVAIL